MAADHAALFEVSLVVLLGFPEDSRQPDLRCDGIAVGSRRVQLRNLGTRLRGLPFALRKDDGAVLGSEVRSLPVDLGWVVHREERVQ